MPQLHLMHSAADVEAWLLHAGAPHPALHPNSYIGKPSPCSQHTTGLSGQPVYGLSSLYTTQGRAGSKPYCCRCCLAPALLQVPMAP
jgi:hypothetical protein